MKSQLIFIASIFYAFLLHSEYNDKENQSQAQQIHIIFNANTQAGVDQDNTINQKSKHESSPTNLIDTNINTQAKDNKPLKQEKELEAREALASYVIRNSVKLLGVYIMASKMANAPFLFPAYLVNRFIIYSNTPYMDKATEEEALQLAKQGKYERPEPIVYPIVHQIHKAFTKK